MKRFMLMVTVGCLAATAVEAQTANEASAYVALSYTPVAGMAPTAPFVDTLGRRGVSRTTLSGRLGHMNRRGGLSLTMVGAAIEMATASRWRVIGVDSYS